MNEDNYKKELLEDKKRRKLLEDYTGHSMEYYLRDSIEITNLAKKPVIGNLARKIINKVTPRQYGGQVISIEDALKVVDISEEHVLLPCYCRKLTKGDENLCCINFGSIKELELESKASKSLVEIDAYELKQRLKEWDKKGLVHQVIYGKIPYPISICNCERTYCFPMKQRALHTCDKAFMRGHEVAVVDPKRCDGCGKNIPRCVHLCQFGAIHYNRQDNHVHIDPNKCFGCGVCRDACDKKAISLINRKTYRY